MRRAPFTLGADCFHLSISGKTTMRRGLRYQRSNLCVGKTEKLILRVGRSYRLSGLLVERLRFAIRRIAEVGQSGPETVVAWVVLNGWVGGQLL